MRLPRGGQVYNPTLALYFFEHLAERCGYPRAMLDNNLARLTTRAPSPMETANRCTRPNVGVQTPKHPNTQLPRAETMARWNLAVSSQTDQAVRLFLASRGRVRKGDLSRFIE